MTTKAVMPALIRAEDIMTHPVIHLHHDMTARDAASSLSANQISGAPVLCGPRVVGVISKSDLLDPRNNGEASTVERLMTKVVYAVRPGDPLMLAVQLMVEEGVHRVLVVDDEQRVVGILTPMDVCRAMLRNASATLGRSSFNRDYVDLSRFSGEEASP